MNATTVTSCIDFGSCQHIFAAVNIMDDSVATCDAIKDIIRRSMHRYRDAVVVKTMFFLRDQSQKAAVLGAFSHAFGQECQPCVSLLLQPPSKGIWGSALFWAVVGDVLVSSSMREALAVRQKELTWLIAGASGSEERTASRDRDIKLMFRRLEERLTCSLDQPCQLLRTWFAIPEIICPEKTYHLFNEIRHQVYEQWSSREDHAIHSRYPAGTGVGTRDECPVGSVIACKLGAASRIVSLENPLQTPATEYKPCYSPAPPSFVRAKAVALPGAVLTLVSGTASIRGAESRHLGNVSAQTELALDNIDALLGEENMRRHGISAITGGLKTVKCAVIYVKNEKMIPAARRACQARLSEAIPILYAVADLCREELLVEI